MGHVNPEEAREYKRQYYLDNLEKIKDYRSAKYRANPKAVIDKVADWQRNNPEKRKIQCIKYRKKHSEELKEKSRQRSEEVKFAVLSHYSGGDPSCAVCGTKDIDVLQLDHIENNGSTHRKSLKCFGGVGFYRRLRVQGFPPGHQVLCANCNTKKEIMRRRTWLKY